MTFPIEWVTVDEVIALNRRVVEVTLEGFLVADRGGLESAVARPEQHFHYGDPEDHDDLVLLATKLCIGISEAQAFQQGNKRTGLAALEMMLNLNGYGLSADAHGRIASMVLASADPDHNIRLTDEDFAETIDEFVIESDQDFARDDLVDAVNFEEIGAAMGAVSMYDSVTGYEAINVISVGFTERPTRFEGMKSIEMPDLLTPEQYRKLCEVDIDKIAFKREDLDGD